MLRYKHSSLNDDPPVCQQLGPNDVADKAVFAVLEMEEYWKRAGLFEYWIPRKRKLFRFRKPVKVFLFAVVTLILLVAVALLADCKVPRLDCVHRAG